MFVKSLIALFIQLLFKIKGLVYKDINNQFNHIITAQPTKALSAWDFNNFYGYILKFINNSARKLR